MKKIAIIGGSGLYELEGLEKVNEKEVITPFGKASGPIIEGELEGLQMVFLPRHGKGHRLSPSEINYRANIYALKQLGATHVVSVSAVGSLKENLKPGDFLFPDQFIDRTKGVRESSFFTDGIVAHVGFSDPVCMALHEDLLEAAKATQKTVHEKGTYVCMEGPQFSTRAESNLYRSWNADIIGMTNIPECKLAREAELCYATCALVTDYDCWKIHEEAVSVDSVIKTLLANIEGAKKLIKALPKAIKDEKKCSCSSALENAIITNKNFISTEVRERLKPLISKYL